MCRRHGTIRIPNVAMVQVTVVVDSHGIDRNHRNQYLVKEVLLEEDFVDERYDIQKTCHLVYPEIMNVLRHVIQKGSHNKISRDRSRIHGIGSQCRHHRKQKRQG